MSGAGGADSLRSRGPAACAPSTWTLAAIEQFKMSPPQREVVRLTGLGYTAEEIGVRMNLSPNTVATHLKRARAAYDKALKRT